MKERIFPAKVIYILSRNQFEAVVDVGFTVKMLMRFKVMDVPDLEHEDFQSAKRIMDKHLLNNRVYIRTFRMADFHGVWEAKVYKKTEANVVENGLRGVPCLSDLIAEEDLALMERRSQLNVGKEISEKPQKELAQEVK